MVKNDDSERDKKSDLVAHAEEVIETLGPPTGPQPGWCYVLNAPGYVEAFFEKGAKDLDYKVVEINPDLSLYHESSTGRLIGARLNGVLSVRRISDLRR